MPRFEYSFEVPHHKHRRGPGGLHSSELARYRKPYPLFQKQAYARRMVQEGLAFVYEFESSVFLKIRCPDYRDNTCSKNRKPHR